MFRFTGDRRTVRSIYHVTNAPPPKKEDFRLFIAGKRLPSDRCKPEMPELGCTEIPVGCVVFSLQNASGLLQQEGLKILPCNG